MVERVRQGRVAGLKVISCRTPSGSRPGTQAATASRMCAGFWPATSRKDSFTIAEDGMIVLLPGPW